MYASQNGASDVDSFVVDWGPRLVRFYFFVCADKGLAEASAIETITEALRPRRSKPNLSALVRLAAIKAASLQDGSPNGDRMARALLALPPRERLALAFARGMGTSPELIAEALAIDLAGAKRLLADALLGLHRELSKEPNGLEKPREI